MLELRRIRDQQAALTTSKCVDGTIDPASTETGRCRVISATWKDYGIIEVSGYSLRQIVDCNASRWYGNGFDVRESLILSHGKGLI